MPKRGNEFETALRGAMSYLRPPITDEQIALLRSHFEAIVDANRVMNLTRITDPAEAAIKHYADSLVLLAWVRDRAITTVLDVGTGAGFPAVPLAVMRPEWSVTAIDGTGKKIEFVRRTAHAMGLSNLRCLHVHSAQWRTPERFDLVTFRALAALPRAVERSARFVAPGGSLIAYQTANLDPDHLAAAEAAAARHGLALRERYPYEQCHNDDILRRLLLVLGRGG